MFKIKEDPNEIHPTREYGPSGACCSIFLAPVLIGIYVLISYIIINLIH